MGFAKGNGEQEDLFQRRRLAYARLTGVGEDHIQILTTAADRFTREFGAVRTAPRYLREQVLFLHVAEMNRDLGAHDAFVLMQYINSSIKPKIGGLVPVQ